MVACPLPLTPPFFANQGLTDRAAERLLHDTRATRLREQACGWTKQIRYADTATRPKPNTVIERTRSVGLSGPALTPIVRTR
jgi:hypothetical protein